MNEDELRANAGIIANTNAKTIMIILVGFISDPFEGSREAHPTCFFAEVVRLFGAAALSYLYNKEAKSSFEIENIKPGASRTEKFVGLLNGESGPIRE